jgi:hypothetical protein
MTTLTKTTVKSIRELSTTELDGVSGGKMTVDGPQSSGSARHTKEALVAYCLPGYLK